MCQKVENRIAGAPCGIMDQVTSCFGQAGALLRMVCQPHDLRLPLRFPEGVRVVGINSNVRHSVGGGQYGRVRCAAFMGHKGHPRRDVTVMYLTWTVSTLAIAGYGMATAAWQLMAA